MRPAERPPALVRRRGETLLAVVTLDDDRLAALLAVDALRPGP